MCATFMPFSCNLKEKFDYGYFVIFLRYGSKILHKKIQVILTKNEGVTLIFLIQNEMKIRKNRRHAFIFSQYYLKYFV